MKVNESSAKSEDECYFHVYAVHLSNARQGRSMRLVRHRFRKYVLFIFVFFVNVFYSKGYKNRLYASYLLVNIKFTKIGHFYNNIF